MVTGEATGDRATAPALGRSGSAGLAALQCELRALFLNRPTNRALAEGLERIGQHLGADYAVVHARLGTHFLSEEWAPPEASIEDETRELVHTVLWEAVSDEAGRISTVPGAQDQSSVIAGLMHDVDATPSGGASFVIRQCTEARGLQILACLEGILGYLALLIGGSETARTATVAERRAIEPKAAAQHPQHLAMSIVSEMQTRYGCDLVSIGFVQGSHVRVMAVSGMDEIRRSNPGIELIRASMEECLDRGEAVLCSSSRDAKGDEDDCRLHAQWSHSCQGAVVASFPLVFDDEILAIVSMREGAGVPIDRQRLLVAEDEMSGYAALVPLSLKASRGLLEHTKDSVRRTLRACFRGGIVRSTIVTVTAVVTCAFLLFGSIDYTFTVPCTVKAEDHRTISCPRNGVLAELFVRPGDHVRAGQLIAALDAKADVLRSAELRAEIESLDALVDKALAERQTGQLRIHQSRKRSLLAQLTSTEASIEQAKIRAPRDGVILSGDLRERLGSRLGMGDSLFSIARYDRATILMQVPEKLVLAARDAQSTEFSTAARPDRVIDVEAIRVAPASQVIDERNVFLAEGRARVTLAQVAPGMEGVAHINAGPRAAWWVLTHRVTDWLRLNFWM